MATTRPTTESRLSVQYNNGIPFEIKNHSGLLTTSQIAIGEPRDFIRENRIQFLECEDVTLTLPFPLEDSALQLFDGVLKGRLTSVFVTIIRSSINGDTLQSFELGNCEIIEVAFPALDGASRDAGTATITLKPEYIDLASGTNSSRTPVRVTHRNAFSASNFSIEIDGVETTRIKQVSTLAVSPHLQSSVDSQKNGVLNTKNNLDFIEFKTIRVNLSQLELDKPGWQSWLNDFVKNQQQGKNGTLKFLKPDMRSSLLEISLRNLFIVSTLYQGAAVNRIAEVSIELMFDAAVIQNITKPKEVKFVRSGLEINLPEVTEPVKPKITKFITP